ncbi:type II secretion system protein [bacterium]|nr:type II secretion system protein [bacterium]
MIKLFGMLDEKLRIKLHAFTLTEVLISLAIVAILSVLLIPVVTTRAQNKALQLTFNSQIRGMLNSFQALPINENVKDITGTMMYVDSAPENGDWSSSSGAYQKKYMKVAKFCGNSPDECFASKYYRYDNHKRKDFDKSVIQGSCVLLRNGVSLCLKPIIGDGKVIEGHMDLNGSKGPNIYGRDLRSFKIDPEKLEAYTELWTGEVLVVTPDEELLDCTGTKWTDNATCCTRTTDSSAYISKGCCGSVTVHDDKYIANCCSSSNWQDSCCSSSDGTALKSSNYTLWQDKCAPDCSEDKWSSNANCCISSTADSLYKSKCCGDDSVTHDTKWTDLCEEDCSEKKFSDQDYCCQNPKNNEAYKKWGCCDSAAHNQLWVENGCCTSDNWDDICCTDALKNSNYSLWKDKCAPDCSEDKWSSDKKCCAIVDSDSDLFKNSCCSKMDHNDRNAAWAEGCCSASNYNDYNSNNEDSFYQDCCRLVADKSGDNWKNQCCLMDDFKNSDELGCCNFRKNNITNNYAKSEEIDGCCENKSFADDNPQLCCKYDNPSEECCEFFINNNEVLSVDSGNITACCSLDKYKDDERCIPQRNCFDISTYNDDKELWANECCGNLAWQNYAKGNYDLWPNEDDWHWAEICCNNSGSLYKSSACCFADEGGESWIVSYADNEGTSKWLNSCCGSSNTPIEAEAGGADDRCCPKYWDRGTGQYLFEGEVPIDNNGDDLCRSETNNYDSLNHFNYYCGTTSRDQSFSCGFGCSKTLQSIAFYCNLDNNNVDLNNEIKEVKLTAKSKCSCMHKDNGLNGYVEVDVIRAKYEKGESYSDNANTYPENDFGYTYLDQRFYSTGAPNYELIPSNSNTNVSINPQEYCFGIQQTNCWEPYDLEAEITFTNNEIIKLPLKSNKGDFSIFKTESGEYVAMQGNKYLPTVAWSCGLDGHNFKCTFSGSRTFRGSNEATISIVPHLHLYCRPTITGDYAEYDYFGNRDSGNWAAPYIDNNFPSVIYSSDSKELEYNIVKAIVENKLKVEYTPNIGYNCYDTTNVDDNGFTCDVNVFNYYSGGVSNGVVSASTRTHSSTDEENFCSGTLQYHDSNWNPDDYDINGRKKPE